MRIKINGSEILKLNAEEEDITLESIRDKLHIDLDTAIKVALANITENNELPEDIFNLISGKLTDEEKQLFISMLTGKGIKVMPITSLVKKAEAEMDIEQIKEEIINATNEKGEISVVKLEKILEKVTDDLVKSKIMEWLTETPLVQVKQVKEPKGMKETEYQKRVKRKVKRITGMEVF